MSFILYMRFFRVEERGGNWGRGKVEKSEKEAELVWRERGEGV